MADLGPRLEAALALLSGAKRLADVGADHGHLAIEAVARGLVKSAVASDVREDPCAKAAENVRAAGLSGSIEVRCADGLPAAVSADAVAILGMGGRLIVRILYAACLAGVDRLVLGPNSDAGAVRGWLEENDFAIDQEQFVKDRGKYYQVMLASPGTMRLNAAERAFGPLILQKQGPALREYVARRIAELNEAAMKAANPEKQAEIRRKTAFFKELIR